VAYQRLAAFQVFSLDILVGNLQFGGEDNSHSDGNLTACCSNYEISHRIRYLYPTLTKIHHLSQRSTRLAQPRLFAGEPTLSTKP
jgi:hypothetical protein